MWGTNGGTRNTVVSSIAAVALAGTTYWMYQLISEFGVDGALRYIWDGDPTPHHLRDRIGILISVEKKLKRLEKSLSVLEEGLERARLDSVDGDDGSHIRKLWERNIPDKDLRQRLALLSYDLDQYAAMIDQVLGAEDEADIKARKKALSKRIVKFMDRADAMIGAFNDET